jgi:hypothetical protein
MIQYVLRGDAWFKPSTNTLAIFIDSRHGIESYETLKGRFNGVMNELHNLSKIHDYETDTHG